MTSSLHGFLNRPVAQPRLVVSGDEFGQALFVFLASNFLGYSFLRYFRDVDALTLYDKTDFTNTTLVFHGTDTRIYQEGYKHNILVLVDKVGKIPENFFHIDCKWSRKEGVLILTEVIKRLGINQPEADTRLLGDRLSSFEDLHKLINLYTVCPTLTPSDAMNIIPMKNPSVEYLFLHRKIADLIREAQLQPAISYLTALHKILYKVYCWLEGSKISEEQTIDLLGLKRYELGTWKSLPAVYNPRLVREALEEVAECLKQVKNGEKKLWVVRLYNVLTKFGG